MKQTDGIGGGCIYVRLFYKIDFIIALLALSITELSNEAK